MPLNVGSRIAHYDVTALIGEGGMGQVYKATDTKLNRQVALKILPEAFAEDPDRLARFQREAQVLASLNHPGIAAIYGIEEQDGTRALVLELVEGPTLAERISKGPIPLDEALPIAKQIAEALEAAHEAGVIHRDLKPANIKVRDDGTVKVLDFGLAKALDPSPTGDPSQSPTLTAAATQMGVIMGTAAYMSPEQAKGKTVDRRSDVWAFGAVLYEMLSGRRAFAGDDVSDTLALVLKFEPEWNALPPDTPPRICRLLQACSQKEPSQRIQAIGDVRLAMAGAFETTARPSSEPALTEKTGWRLVLPLALVSLGIGAIAAGVTVRSLMRPEPPRVVRFTVSPSQMAPLGIAGRSPDVAVSPSGEHVVYVGGGVGGNGFLVRPLDQLVAETLVATGEDLNSPFFSPDGASVGFYNNTTQPELQRVAVHGGPVSTICELRGQMAGASWGDDGTIIFGTVESSSGLWRVAAVGGEPEQITTPDPEQGEVDHVWPEMLPGSAAVLFTIQRGSIDDSRIAVLSLETGEQKVLGAGSFPRYSPTGHLVYGVQGNLWAVAFDPDRLETRGDPLPVLEGVMMKDSGAANFGLSDDGSLVYIPGSAARARRRLVWVDREGQEELLQAPPAPYESPRISPDGRYVAVEVREPGNTDITIYDLERETPIRLTFDPGADGWPLWSPDGQRIFFSSDRDGGLANIYAVTVSGAGQPVRVTTSETHDLRPESWSGDGQSLVILADDGIRLPGLQVVSLDGESRPEGLIETDFVEGRAEISPDGRWMAYQSSDSGEFEVFVRPFPNIDDDRWQISRDGAQEPVWAPDGRELFFRPLSGEMAVVAVDTDPVFRPGNTELLFQAPYRSTGRDRARPWDLAADGRFLMI